jgi:Icc-related predicted phosphoesterase
MKILALSDRVVESIYSPQVCEMYGDVSLVVGCGDLPYYYLEYVVTQLPVPVVYVHGNHDRTQHMADGRRVVVPEGCLSLEGQTVEAAGLLLAGLGGSMRYQPDAPHQYTEREMRARVVALAPKLLANHLMHGRYLDILVTHSPPLGIHDDHDLPHQGFKSLLTLMRYFKPRLMLHGHTHIYRRDNPTTTRYHQTDIVNVYPNRVIAWDGLE